MLRQEDCLEFLEEERLKGLIKRYSEFINFPIYLYTSKEEASTPPSHRSRHRHYARAALEGAH